MKSVRIWSFSGPYFPAFGPEKLRTHFTQKLFFSFAQSASTRQVIKLEACLGPAQTSMINKPLKTLQQLIVFVN